MKNDRKKKENKVVFYLDDEQFQKVTKHVEALPYSPSVAAFVRHLVMTAITTEVS